MTKENREFLLENGFKEDDGKEILLDILSKNPVLKSVSITIFTGEDPYILLARTEQTKVKSMIDSTRDMERLILHQGQYI